MLRASKVGGYIDSWEYDSDPEWGAVAMMRYKSRRDLVELMLDPQFSDMHVFKMLAIEKTVSFPLQMQFSFFMNPKFSVPFDFVVVGILSAEPVIFPQVALAIEFRIFLNEFS